MSKLAPGDNMSTWLWGTRILVFALLAIQVASAASVPSITAAVPTNDGGKAKAEWGDDSSVCTITTPKGTLTYYPGLFTGGNASTVPEDCSALPSPTEVPKDSVWPFFFATAVSAYQTEGAWDKDGKGPSIWDTFTHTPNKIWNNETGDVATDFYHRFLEDIQIMKALGHRNFRFSLSWPRLFPNGTGEVNQAGVDFYNKVIDALLANCIEPWVTVYHWDLPQALEDKYKGWLDKQIVDDFAYYSAQVFTLFGDRVKHWFTLNEPTSFCFNGYVLGVHAPGRCADRTICEEGDQVGEGLLCSYHAMLAHAAGVKAFREIVPDGKIGLTNIMYHSIPLTNSSEDIAAAERLNEFANAHFLDPVYTGDWTPSRKDLLPEFLLPRFTPDEQQLMKASKPDFLALQYYSGFYAYANESSLTLGATTTITDANNNTLGVAEPSWLAVFPVGLKELLKWLHKRYPNETLLITETGVAAPGENQVETEPSLCDKFRIDFYSQYIGNASAAAAEGVPLEGIFGWTLMDNFEWAAGTNWRFGIVRTDFDTLERYLKASALWLSNQFGLSDLMSAADASAV